MELGGIGIMELAPYLEDNNNNNNVKSLISGRNYSKVHNSVII